MREVRWRFASPPVDTSIEEHSLCVFGTVEFHELSKIYVWLGNDNQMTRLNEGKVAATQISSIARVIHCNEMQVDTSE